MAPESGDGMVQDGRDHTAPENRLFRLFPDIPAIPKSKDLRRPLPENLEPRFRFQISLSRKINRVEFSPSFGSLG